MEKKFTLLLVMILIGLSQTMQSQLIIQNNTEFTTINQMFLANELFESGEPFAEELGYNLDDLDPEVLNQPDSISYSTGIENYEYSRYLLNTLNGRSGLGLHMMWSPVVMANAAMQDDSFDGSMTGGTPNGYKEDDMMMMMIGNFGANANQTPPAHAFPQFADFASGNIVLPQNVASNFAMDFASTRWDRSQMDKTLNLGSMGQSMWKQYYWAQDMLSAFHDGNDEGIDATGSNSPDFPDSPMLDPDNNIFYGGNNLDGFIGQVLTAVSINKTKFLLTNMAYDGTTLGMVDPASYNPSNGIKYFPTKIGVTETLVLAGLPPQASSFNVVDEKSLLFDQLSFLLATSNYKNMMNPNDNSDAAHLAYHEAFDGFPFPASMSETGTPGPFNLMTGASKVLFLNIMAMHFNSTAGTFVDESELNAGAVAMGNTISTLNASYILVSLTKFADEFVGTPLEEPANNAIIAQANFILANLKDASGGYYNGFTIGAGASSDTKTLEANAAVIRGLYAAYNHTGDTTYLNEANAQYNYLINNYYIASDQVFRTELNNNTATYTPKNLAILSGALREASLQGEQADAPVIYNRMFKTIYNKMILTEAEATGETGGDSDGDGIDYIAGGDRPFVFAEEATYSSSVGVDNISSQVDGLTVYPNPATEDITVSLANNTQNAVISLYDLQGKLVSAKAVASVNTQLAVDQLEPGLYFLRVTQNNEVIAIQKIAVE